jgi:hypothetical protein
MMTLGELRDLLEDHAMLPDSTQVIIEAFDHDLSEPVEMTLASIASGGYRGSVLYIGVAVRD